MSMVSIYESRSAAALAAVEFAASSRADWETSIREMEVSAGHVAPYYRKILPDGCKTVMALKVSAAGDFARYGEQRYAGKAETERYFGWVA